MPSWELLEEQSVEYQQSIFPASVPVMSIEAGGTQGWQKWSHAQFGLNSFGKQQLYNDDETYFYCC